MCKPGCKSAYGKAFDVLSEKTDISTSDSYYKFLQTKTNMACVRAFLASIASKVK